VVKLRHRTINTGVTIAAPATVLARAAQEFLRKASLMEFQRVAGSCGGRNGR
jgi:hypothetical protein